MTLYLSPETAGAFTRIALTWKSGRRDCELVLERRRGGRLRLLVSMGSKREEHDLELHAEGFAGINGASKLIKLEESGASLPAPRAKKARPAPVRQQSKLITIEDTHGRQLVELALPSTAT